MVSSQLSLDMLMWEQCDCESSGLQPDRELSGHCLCMFFNDEVHTHEQVWQVPMTVDMLVREQCRHPGWSPA